MKNIKKLTLLHSNDLHGDFLAEKPGDEYIGGISLLSGYISRVRKEEKNVIYAIAGDMFVGSIIDSEYKGISTIEIMNMLAPDIATIGNHEVDYGVAHLLFAEKCANFPIINANLYIKNNNAHLFTPYKIFEIDGMKILFIGVVTDAVLDKAKNEPVVGSLIDVKDAAEEVTRICNAYRSIDIDFTVLLTHIGIEEDIKLAKTLDPSLGVDIIIGGHSHTVMQEPVCENGIVIAHAGMGTDKVGRFDINIDTYKNSIDSFTWEFVPINEKTCQKDESIEELINKYKTATDIKYERVITRFECALTHPRRYEETSLGNLISDILKERLGLDIMFFSSGGIRTEKLGPIVTYADIIQTLPFDDEVYLLKINGKTLKNMLRFMLRDDALDGGTEFYQLSDGIRLIYSPEKHDFIRFSYNGQDVKDDDVFNMGIEKYHFESIEKFLGVPMTEIEQLQKPRQISTSCEEIVEEYLACHQNIFRQVEGRIVIIKG